MRKYSEFKNIWLGETCRDGQCVALYREYTEGFHDTPILERLGVDGGASRLFTDYGDSIGPVTRSIFYRISYRGDDERPLTGDVVILGPTNTNKYGHVGIMDSECNEDIILLDQNGIAAMEGKPVKVKLSPFKMARVLGWLRFKREEGIR